MSSAALLASLAKIIKVAVDLTPVVIKTVEDAKPFADLMIKTFQNGTEVTQSELDELIAKVQALSAELQKPLDPE